ncbi:MAG TPA: hypothetical protein VK926_00235 [Gaiellaceae bacterium]|nr:hypothetical protein [Gaiellaceae bacterium]
MRIPLSSFRILARLRGASHPAVYHVHFACTCGEEHDGLVSHDDLDWAHLGTASEGSFRNLMTSRDDPVTPELADMSASRIRAGEWPWSFFCFPEARPRPVTPSAFVAIAPGDRCFGVAVRCPACAAASINLVTQAHVDIPFWNDSVVGVVEHVFRDDAERLVEQFRAELHSWHFDERRLDLEL